MESGELIAVLIVVIILLVGTIFLCFRCWKAIGEVADDHMKPKRETRAQMVRGAIRRSFRRTAQGIQRGAGTIRDSFRRARGRPPPGAPVPEEPGPPGRPYGSRGGARRYPGRPGHQPRGPGQPQGPGSPPGPWQTQSPGYPTGPTQPQGPRPVQPQPVPSVSAQTPDGPGHSDIHPAYLPKNKRPTGTGSQSDAPPTYQEALSHETAENRAALVRSERVEVHKTPPRASAYQPPRDPSAPPSETPPPPVPPAPYPEQLSVPMGYHQQGTPKSPHTPVTPQSAPRTPQEGYQAPYQPYTPDRRSRYPESDQRSPYPQPDQRTRYPQDDQRSPHPQSDQRPPYPQDDFRDRQPPHSSYSPRYPNQSSQSPHTPAGAPPPPVRSRDRLPESSRDYHRSRSQPGTTEAEHHQGYRPEFSPDYSRSRSQDSRDYPHLQSAPPVRDNEYTSEPPLPTRNYNLPGYEEDDGGFGVAREGRRAMSSSSHPHDVPREYMDYRSHDSVRPSGARISGGLDEVDYAGYSQIPMSHRNERDPPYSPTSMSYQNEAFVGDTRMPGDGAYTSPGQSQGYRSGGQGQRNDTGQSPYYPQRAPLPPLPRDGGGTKGQQQPDPRAHARYNPQQGVVFPASDRRYMDSDTYI